MMTLEWTTFSFSAIGYALTLEAAYQWDSSWFDQQEYPSMTRHSWFASEWAEGVRRSNRRR